MLWWNIFGELIIQWNVDCSQLLINMIRVVSNVLTYYIDDEGTYTVKWDFINVKYIPLYSIQGVTKMDQNILTPVSWKLVLKEMSYQQLPFWAQVFYNLTFSNVGRYGTLHYCKIWDFLPISILKKKFFCVFVRFRLMFSRKLIRNFLL